MGRSRELVPAYRDEQKHGARAGMSRSRPAPVCRHEHEHGAVLACHDEQEHGARVAMSRSSLAPACRDYSTSRSREPCLELAGAAMAGEGSSSGRPGPWLRSSAPSFSEVNVRGDRRQRAPPTGRRGLRSVEAPLEVDSTL
nr:unnamed protein product [Digitaria exilis]